MENQESTTNVTITMEYVEEGEVVGMNTPTLNRLLKPAKDGKLKCHICLKEYTNGKTLKYHVRKIHQDDTTPGINRVLKNIQKEQKETKKQTQMAVKGNSDNKREILFNFNLHLVDAEIEKDRQLYEPEKVLCSGFGLTTKQGNETWPEAHQRKANEIINLVAPGNQLQIKSCKFFTVQQEKMLLLTFLTENEATELIAIFDSRKKDFTEQNISRYERPTTTVRRKIIQAMAEYLSIKKTRSAFFTYKAISIWEPLLGVKDYSTPPILYTFKNAIIEYRSELNKIDFSKAKQFTKQMNEKELNKFLVWI